MTTAASPAQQAAFNKYGALSRRHFSVAALLAAVGLLGAGVPSHAQPRRNQALAADAPRLGLKGYDPVAYFTLGVPTQGHPDFEHVWDRTRYRFASALHLRMFRVDPDRYAPQFGGLCAMNMANGIRLEPDPTVWVISDGKLYVFSGLAGPVRFRAEEASNAAKAAANWTRLADSPSQ